MRSLAIPSGASRLVSKKLRTSSRADLLQPCPDYPSNACCFTRLDVRLLPHWHALFDVCPALLKLDPPEGLNMFRSFMKWACRNSPALNWTYRLSVCRWLLTSSFKKHIREEHIEAFMTAAAASWVEDDDGPARGLVLAWKGSPLRVFDWKVETRRGDEVDPQQQVFPPTPWDFAWCPLAGEGSAGLRQWLPIPGYDGQPPLSNAVRDE
ncbi:putative natural product biosynthesis protein [Pseudomonas syringae group genomosp. 3]|uniref:Natural product biosynthesis protein n=1 Tax=Pseudomonas syringae pv. maculicola TaxID=59511 RepID=A0A0N0WX07_PSEYM|nr:putative natural product biosynthesis protein [Pseudomonas syringae group genomosp. 3]KPB89571.1 Uncharacterized protein AC506_0198 [Pseudomonas syringae pv. maculicola str. M6]KPC10604.1 Uncharacterized protein AC503_5123 [Pseudomonas syringae pv. maculicola]MBM0212893.1 putative natural product biosynthesis protein [Pseudomonas syringae pv. maculicola]QQN24929.1 putative natural product biosynthesis protein [Pseudomonas syringae pv. maculicola]RMM71469.1 hypothetical protein ALQ72_03329 [